MYRTMIRPVLDHAVTAAISAFVPTALALGTRPAPPPRPNPTPPSSTKPVDAGAAGRVREIGGGW